MSPKSVMRAIQKTGEVCQQADIKLAHELYVNGVLPKADAQPDIILGYIKTTG